MINLRKELKEQAKKSAEVNKEVIDTLYKKKNLYYMIKVAVLFNTGNTGGNVDYITSSINKEMKRLIKLGWVVDNIDFDNHANEKSKMYIVKVMPVGDSIIDVQEEMKDVHYEAGSFLMKSFYA